MITLSGGFRPQFKEKVKNFCSENNLTITYLQNVGNSYYFNIDGETTDIEKLMQYTDKLERENKGFWWRLWN